MSSFEKSSKNYGKLVGEKGHYYHQSVVLPHLLTWLKSAESLLDLGCGQGVLSRHLPDIDYIGLDLSKSLIQQAKSYSPPSGHKFLVQDITCPYQLSKKDFSHAVFNLSLQNLEGGDKALVQAAAHLRPQGVLLLILNHPCFRIPRQSSWGIDEEKDFQYRRIDRYLSPMKIPIQMEPSLKEKSPLTWSFHHSLSTYSLWLLQAGFWIEEMQEWVSEKKSSGKACKRENRARGEFPLFLGIKAIKK